MKNSRHKIVTTLLLCMLAGNAFCSNPNDLGQTIQIYTRLQSFPGKPSWLLMIRDIDHNQNIPYVYEFDRKNNFWLAFTFGRNYLITASRLSFFPYPNKKISNFCGLESNGRIIRGQSLYITITGKLSTNTRNFQCSVMRYQDANFAIAPSNPG